MTLSLLENIASHFKQYRQITHLKRIGDNLFKLELDEEIFYLDLQKHKSTIFIAPSISGNKPYQAPFDILLSKLTTRAKILDCHCDGSNRILILHCRQNHPYKTAEFFLHFEFTGRHTNAILVDSRGIILEALRHLKHTGVNSLSPHFPITKSLLEKYNKRYQNTLTYHPIYLIAKRR